MVEFMSSHKHLPANASLSCCGKSVQYGHALRAFRDIVASAGRRPEQLPSTRYGLDSHPLSSWREVTPLRLQFNERGVGGLMCSR